MQGRIGWDEIFSTPETVKDTVKFWLDNIDRFNGRRWWPRPIGIEVKVDASGVGFGGNIQTTSAGRVPFAGTFTEDQAKTSSTEREVLGYGAALEVIAQQSREDVNGSAVLLYEDNQGAISVLNKLRSRNPGINKTLQKVCNLCCRNEFDLVAKWVPKEDELSRQPHPSDWGLSLETF
jgi:hypothetical protein